MSGPITKSESLPFYFWIKSFWVFFQLYILYLFSKGIIPVREKKGFNQLQLFEDKIQVPSKLDGSENSDTNCLFDLHVLKERNKVSDVQLFS